MPSPDSTRVVETPPAGFWHLAREPRIAWTSLRVALVVGSVLTAINQGPALFEGLPPDPWKTLLTYFVPYLVSTYGAVTSRLRQHDDPRLIGSTTNAMAPPTNPEDETPARTLARIHHVNVLVRDLAAAMRFYERHLGVREMIRETLPARGVDTARFRVGQSWVVLVTPTDPLGIPGRHLATHGEGLFLISFGVADLAAATAAWQREAGTTATLTLRRGLGGWRICDLPGAPGAPSVTQLCELDASSG